MEQPVATRPEDVVRNTKLIKLPRTQGGREMWFRIQELPTHETLEHLGVVPSLHAEAAAQPSVEKVREMVFESKDRLAALACAGVVEPPLSAGPEREAGKAWWWDLSPENQTFVVLELQTFSGGNSEAATRTVSFPEDGAGAPAGAAAGEEGEGGSGSAVPAA